MVRRLFRNGTVWTGADRVDALSVRDSRIETVGVNATDADEIIDLDGGLLLPAFGDGHCHPDHAGFQRLGPQLNGHASVPELVDAVRRYADDHPEQEWILGGGYDSTLVPDGLFDARWLDAAIPDRPVALRAWDYHTVWCNSEAMRRAGLGPSVADTERGVFVRRADGGLLGTMREWDAVDAVLSAAPGRTDDEWIAALGGATESYAAAGVTWIQDACVEHEAVDRYLEAARRGALAVRVNLALRADPARWRDQLAEFAEDLERVRALEHPLLTVGTVKFFMDGILENRTAALLDPYSDDPCSRGLPIWPYPELLEAFRAIDAMGLQAHLHAIGDAGVRTALDAVEHVTQVNGPRDRRPVIAHVQLPDPADLPRFARLGVIANLTPIWAQRDPVMVEQTLPRIGAERARQQYPLGSLLRSGARVSFGSDWPCGDPRPLVELPVAVTRQTPAREPAGGWLPEERVSLQDALCAYTAGVAYQAFAEHQRGTLTPGTSADLVWLDRDLFDLDPHEISQAAVRGTWLAGSRIFAAEPTAAGRR
jgi:predicted amidohydrolase YtcJ